MKKMRKAGWGAVGAGILALGLAPLAGGCPQPPATAVAPGCIQGRVLWVGEIPVLPPLPVTKDIEVCGRDIKNGQKCLVKVDESLLVDPVSRGVANAVLWLKGVEGGPEVKEAKIDQRCGQYVPHVLVIKKGQNVKLLNSDGRDRINYCFCWFSKHNPSGHVCMRRSQRETMLPSDDGVFERPEFILALSDLHPWMRGWIGVMENGYFGKTDEKGAFRIEGVPPGSYTLCCWHEPVYPEDAPFLTEQAVTVEAGKDTAASFTLKGK